MKKLRNLTIFGVFFLIGVVLYLKVRDNSLQVQSPQSKAAIKIDKSKINSDDYWKEILSPEQYYILRKQGTEVPYTGALLHEKRKGTYYSVGCDEPLFRSETKFESNTGWPSFYEPIKPDAVVLKTDKTLGVERTEVLDRCGNHLGHVFDDGPEPTGKRYCMNSIALRFIPDKNQ